MSVRVERLLARPRPEGHRIDLTWVNGPSTSLPGIRVVRREHTYPTGPEDGTTVAHESGASGATDSGLRGETVYYYALFGFAGDPPAFAPTPVGRASAPATGRYGFAELMFGLLPAIYRRYDALALPAPDAQLDPDARDHGALRRFLELPGSVLDQLYGLARTSLSCHDLDRVDGALLPLLAQWIGWRTDHGLAIPAQRREIRFAPPVYHAVGTVAGLSATVRRVTHRSARTKEYVHNVARTNTAERLNLFATVGDGAGAWSAPELVSVHHAHDGRAAHVRDADGTELVVLHTYRRHGWDIWAKRRAAGSWLPSEPLVDRPGVDRDPVVALQADRLWLFWSGRAPTGPTDPRGEAARPWQLYVRTRRGADGPWSDAAVFAPGPADQANPALAVDADAGLWLFWREWAESGWRIRFNRHDGTGWQLPQPGTVPTDVPADADLIAAVHPGHPERPLWLFWAHRAELADSGGQRRWRLAGLVKRGLDPAAADWEPVPAPAVAKPADHDREPAPQPLAGGGLALYWSSTRDGGWGLVRAELDVAAGGWQPAQPVAGSPFSDRGPCPIDLDGGATLLLFRSNRPLAHRGSGAADAPLLDARYAGSTTVRGTDVGKLALRGTADDALTYTYDTRGRLQPGATTLAARDAVGVFLDASAGAPADRLARLAGVLPEALPAGMHAVVIEP